jgi:hypothetical protein
MRSTCSLPIGLRKNKGLKEPVVSQALGTVVAFRRDLYVPSMLCVPPLIDLTGITSGQLPHRGLIDIGAPAGLRRHDQVSILDARRLVTRSSFQGTSSTSISMMRKFGIAAQKWALISVDMWP